MPPHPTSWRSSFILSAIHTSVLQVASSSQVSPPKPCTYVSRPQYMHSVTLGIKVPEWKALKFIVTLNAVTHNCTVL
jgi:hypothetical protein